MNDEPTELTSEDIDRFVEQLMNYEIKPKKCFCCGEDHFSSYGSSVGECDECWFKRFPKEQVEAFCRSFF